MTTIGTGTSATTRRGVAGVAESPRDPRRPFVLGLGGTHRSGSSTERALRASLDGAARTGADTLLLGAEELRLPLFDPTSSERTPAARRLLAAVAAADGLILGSPAYHGGVSGLVKNALDYIEDLRDDARPYLDGRAVGCVVTAGGSQAAPVLTGLRSIVHALRGWPTPLGVAVNTSGPVFGPDGSVADPKTAAQLEAVGRQVAEFAAQRRGAAV
ncbi:NADPH-dependent FMN reductase [Streptomyces sp. bgisy027]|uniref:NADPH-dependent FMN reductase n=1 Tax=Streptomyces sp. bgisy027 TaxID=3413770 RepID=UPI003D73D417